MCWTPNPCIRSCITILLSFALGRAVPASALAVQATTQELRITGIVRDSAGRPLRGAQVFVRGTRSGAITNDSGRFSFAVPRPTARDTLVVEAQMIGFSRDEQRIVRTEVVDSIRVGFTLTEAALFFDTQPSPRPSDTPKCTSPGEGEAEGAPFKEFSYRLFQAIARAAPRDNAIVSPVSTASALALAFTGARGTTAAAIRQALGVANAQALGERTRSWRKSMIEQDCVELTIANAIWADASVPFDPEFVAHSRDVDDALVRSLELRRAADYINTWAGEQTRGRITHVMRDPVDEILLLLNAVYFKGLWLSPFDSLRTSAGPFHMTNADSIEVPRMTRNMTAGYVRRTGFQLARLPYRGDRFAMYVLLPDTGVAPAAIIGRLQADTVDAWIVSARRENLHVVLPRLTVTTVNQLIPPLSEMGMEIAFDRSAADFAGMVAPEWLKQNRLFISRSQQNVFIEVNEQGTEAAAVTSVGFGVTSAPPPPIEFIVDRPFVLLIRDDRTGAVLFIGQIFNPADAR